MTNKENLQNALIQKSKEPQDKVFTLINFIDENQSKLIKVFDGFSWGSVLIIGFFFVIAYASIIGISDFAVSISITLASFAAMIAYFSFMTQVSDKVIIDRRFTRAAKLKKDFDDRQKVLLKALIKIKSENEGIKLETLYAMDKEVNGDTFTEKNLIGLLCK